MMTFNLQIGAVGIIIQWHFRWGKVPYARTDIYKYSFLPETIRDWNALPAAVISSAESSEDPVALFPSLCEI